MSMADSIDRDEMKHEYQSLTDAAAQWGVSRQRAQQWVAAGRVPGAYRIARIWLVPIDAPRPARRNPIRRTGRDSQSQSREK